MAKKQLKPTIGEILDSAKRVVTSHLGDSLVALIHYGVHVASPPTTTGYLTDSVRLLIVVDNLEGNRLLDLSKAFRSIVGMDQLGLMVVTLEELVGSTDVFPITFLEMQRRHRLLAGRDVLESLEIGRGHLRLRCEQELKNLLFRMQSNLVKFGNSERLQDIITRNYEAFSRAVAGSMALMNDGLPESDDDLMKQAASSLNFDLDTLRRVEEVVEAESQVARDWLVSLYPMFIKVVHAAASSVDQYPDAVVVLDALDS